MRTVLLLSWSPKLPDQEIAAILADRTELGTDKTPGFSPSCCGSTRMPPPPLPIEPLAILSLPLSNLIQMHLFGGYTAHAKILGEKASESCRLRFLASGVTEVMLVWT